MAIIFEHVSCEMLQATIILIEHSLITCAIILILCLSMPQGGFPTIAVTKDN